jgi:hypothetical protein
MAKAAAGLCLTLLCALTIAAGAQEVQFIDLTAAPQRVEIRRPPPPSESNTDHGVGTAHASLVIGDCGSDVRDPHSAAAYLDGVDGREIDPSAPIQAEFRFVNTGRLPIDIPVSPDRADLQPPDPSAPFTYLSLALAVGVRDAPGSIGYVELYGAADHNGTTRVLRPGEWIRIKANVKLNSQPACTSMTLMPAFWLRSNSVHATPEGIDQRADNICSINETPTTPVTVLCRQAHGGSEK